MADQKISAMTDGGKIRPTDVVPAVRGGANVKVTPADAFLNDTSTAPSGSIEAGTFPGAALRGMSEATPASASSSVVAGILGMTTHKGADGSGNQHNLGVIGVTDNQGALGTNLATNGTFASDTGWTKGTGWTISAGVANGAAGSGSNLSQVIASLVTSNLYKVTYTITRSAGTVAVNVGGTAGVTRSAAGTYTEWVLCGATTTFAFVKDAAFVGTIDNVTIQRGAHVVGAYAVEGRTHHNSGYTSVAAGFIAAAQTVTEGAQGMILAYADYLSESFNDHAHMYLMFSFLGNDPNKIMRNKGAIDGFKTTIVVETGNFTLSHDTHGGRTVVSTGASPTITVPNSLPNGFTTEVITQGGQASTSAGATLQNASSHTKSRTANSVIGFKCRSNVGGSSAIVTLYGDTAA